MLCMVGVTLSLFAAEVTAVQAKTAVRRWIGFDSALGCRLGEASDEVRTFSTTNNVNFHVVKLKGGGFVVTSADTRMSPVVAFSSEGDFSEDDGNPLLALLMGDFSSLGSRAGSSPARRKRAGTLMSAASSSNANERKWERLLGGGTRLMSDDGQSLISDIRVESFVESKWGQEKENFGPCYNYSTPSNYPCGCVATAGAQVMRYFQWPSSTMSMPQFTNTYCEVDGINVPLTTQGGVYDWSNMPFDAWNASKSQSQAIGKLTADIGICCGMSYGEEYSGIGGYMLAETFTNHFGYGSALAVQWDGTEDISGTDDLRRAVLSNLDARFPVVFSIMGDVDNGHAIIGDGYGYLDSKLFIHMNFGWYGNKNAWYSPPDLATGNDEDFNYSIVNGFIFNIIPDMPPSTVICSGRVLDLDGVPIENADVACYRGEEEVARAKTNARGIYALKLQPGEYDVKAIFGDLSSEATNVTLSANVATPTAYPNTFYKQPEPKVNNICDLNFVIELIKSVDAPQFDPPSCQFYPSTNIAITCTTSDATIRYTLDGSEPTETSDEYTEPIHIDDDVIIKVRAWKKGMNPSAEVSASYAYDYTKGVQKGNNFNDPFKISGAVGSRVVANNYNYTVEAGEPEHTYEEGLGAYAQFKTIWYEWTAPESGDVTFSTELINGPYWYTSMIAVYTGDSLSSIERVCYDSDEDEDGIAIKEFHVTKGVKYRIVGMTYWEEDYGQFTLKWNGMLGVYTVTFDPGEGYVYPETKIVEHEKKYGELPVPVREGFTFEGWMWGETAIDKDSDVIADRNHVLVAQWNINQYAVTFDANGGTGGTSVKQDYGSQIVVPGPDGMERTGYKFAGWSPEVAETVPASNVTYVAQWTPNEYSVAFDGNSGEGDMPPTNLLYGTEYALPSNSFFKSVQSFIGWSLSPDGEVKYADGATV